MNPWATYRLNVPTGLKVGAVTVIIIFVTPMLLSMIQERIIFLPTQLPKGYSYHFDVPFKEFDLKAEDGARLNAIHFQVENPQGLVLYFHGNAGDLSRWGGIASYFGKMGHDVIVMDYRGYGKSTGRRTETALFGDAQLFYDHARSLGYKEEDITVYGRSLGSSLATYVASRNQPSRLVLETPFFNLTDVAKSRFPIIPVERLLRYRFPSDRFIAEVECPVTIFHGTQDDVVPLASGKKLFEKIRAPKSRFYTIAGAAHNNLSKFEGYHKGIAETLAIVDTGILAETTAEAETAP